MASWQTIVVAVFLGVLIIVVGLGLYWLQQKGQQGQKCSKDSDCPSGQTCNVGICACSNNSGCQYGEICVYGTCIGSTVCGSTTCASGQICINSECRGASTIYIQDLVLVRDLSQCPTGYDPIEYDSGGGTKNENLVSGSKSSANPIYLCGKYGPYTGLDSIVTDVIVAKGSYASSISCPSGYNTLQFNLDNVFINDISAGCSSADSNAPHTAICVSKVTGPPVADIEIVTTPGTNCSTGYTPVKINATDPSFNQSNLNQNCGTSTVTQLCLKR